MHIPIKLGSLVTARDGGYRNDMRGVVVDVFGPASKVSFGDGVVIWYKTSDLTLVPPLKITITRKKLEPKHEG